MNNKFYVSLEAARLLKEKGYNEECYAAIDEDNDICECFYRMNQDLSDYQWSCPTKSEAIDWLEGKGIMIEITIDIDECEWIFNIVDKEKFITIGHPKDGEFFTDRLEAEEAAIIKALELLSNCGSVESASIEYFHECSKCGYIVTDSDWEEVTNEEGI